MLVATCVVLPGLLLFVLLYGRELLYVRSNWSGVAFVLFPLFPLSIRGTRGDIYSHLPTSSMELLLASAGVLPWVRGRFNDEVNF
jgi:hypothetical protein